MTEKDWEGTLMKSVMQGIFDKLLAGRPLTREQKEIHEMWLEYKKEQKDGRPNA